MRHVGLARLGLLLGHSCSPMALGLAYVEPIHRGKPGVLKHAEMDVRDFGHVFVEPDHLVLAVLWAQIPWRRMLCGPMEWLTTAQPR